MKTPANKRNAFVVVKYGCCPRDLDFDPPLKNILSRLILYSLSAVSLACSLSVFLVDLIIKPAMNNATITETAIAIISLCLT